MMLSPLISLSVALTAGTWEQTFTAEDTAALLGQPDLRVVVVPAGVPSDALSGAASAVVSALRQSGQARLVMTAEALGDVQQLDDRGIVTRCAGQPVDRVAIVRVYSGVEGQSPSAVVTLYGLDGVILRSASAPQGTRLELAAAPSAAPPGTPSPQPEADDASARQQEYDEQYVGFNDFAVGLASSTGVGQVVRWTEPYKGKYQKPLRGAEFYTYIGRQDLAKQYESRSSTRTLLIGGGIVGALAGGLVAMNGISSREETDVCDLRSPIDNSCMSYEEKSKSGTVGLGVVLMALGGVCATAGFYYDPHPIGASEARRLADDFNQQLKARLEQRQRLNAQAGEGFGIELGVAPWLTPSSRGALLSARW